MKIERWEEETDEEWAERLAEQIAIADNTETTKYFFQSGYEEDEIILNYVGEDSWTWKEHPEGPFKADQIIAWKNKAEKPDTKLDEYIPTFPEAWNKPCPQGWAWLIGSCDFGQNCGECKEPEAPIYAKTRGSSGSAKK